MLNSIKKQKNMPEISGIFEIHITVKAESTEIFVELCSKLGVKPVIIELPYGQHPEQFMTSSWTNGTAEVAKNLAARLVQRITDFGFEVLRVKVEAGASNKGVPEEETPHDPNCYFEFHIKIGIKEQEQGFQDALKKHSAHLSLNSLKGDPNRKFVTLRIYNCGRKAAFNRLGELLLDIKNPLAIEHEFCIMDTNTILDKDWIEQ